MVREILLLAAAVSAAFGASAASLTSAETLQSTSVELPQSDRMFPVGPGSDAINRNCLGCHSAGMVLNQPALPRAAWQAEVDKMIHVYKAPVSPADVGAIVDYLARVNGTTK